MPPAMRASGRWFDKVVLDPEASFEGERDGSKFLSALLEFEDKRDMLFRITNPKNQGLRRLRVALSCSDSMAYIKDKVIPFLRDLGCDALCSGTCKGPLLELVKQIYSLPGFLGSLRVAISAGVQLDVAPVAWLLLTLAREVEHARQDSEILDFMDPLREFAKKSGISPKALHELEVALAGSKAASGRGADFVPLEDLQSGPGGRHDNDQADYRSIKIIPTSEEVLCTRPPYLPSPDDAGEGDLQDSPEAALLDRQFRLVREDMLFSLREVINGFIRSPAASSGQQPGGSRGQSKAKKSVPLSKQRNVFKVDLILGVTTLPVPSLMVEAKLPMNHPTLHRKEMKHVKNRVEYWEGQGRNVLKLDALVCLIPWNSKDDSMPIGPGAPPLIFGTVSRRDIKEMGIKEGSITVGLAFESGKGLSWLLEQIGCGQIQNRLLVQVSTSFFSFKPLLGCMQSMTSVPLAEELVHGRPSFPVTYLPEDVLSTVSNNSDGLNTSQKEALMLALQQRVALIQGPPGTGKTHVAALVADHIMKHSSKKILVISYTNHALDQFLEHLLDRGHTAIVRVGGRSKSERLEALNMFTLTRDSRHTDKVAERRSWDLRDEAKDVGMQVQQLQDMLAFTAAFGKNKKPLLSEAEAAARQDDGPDGAGNPDGGQFYGQNGGQAVQIARGPNGQQGFQSLHPPPPGGRGRGRGRGRGPPPPPPPPPSSSRNPSQPNPAEGGRFPEVLVVPDSLARSKLNAGVEYDVWKVLGPHMDDFFPESYDQLSDKLWKSWLSGLTKIKAQEAPPGSQDKDGFQEVRGGKGKADREMYRRALQTSHNLACGALTESDLPVDLEWVPRADTKVWELPSKRRLRIAAIWLRSLRESWAEELSDKLSRSALVRQDLKSMKMLKDVPVLRGARIIGMTCAGAAKYKDLLQDPAVAPEIVLVEEAGELLEAHVLTSLSPRVEQLIMIGDHKQLPPKVDCYKLSKQSGEGFDLNVSLFERLVTTKGVDHVMLGVQHRMHPEIAKLVQYTYPTLADHESVASHPEVLGLAKGTRVVMIDHRELELSEQQGGPAWKASSESKSKLNEYEVKMTVAVVKFLLQQGYKSEQLVVLTPYLGQMLELQKAISTVKEGEEADIVVASLVRSNEHGSIGFLGHPERINVLMSRARHGLIMIGNTDTLRKAKGTDARRHWAAMLKLMEGMRAILPGLPASCQRHGTRSLLNTPDAFGEKAPDGGCCLPCNYELPCGHLCTKCCHSSDPLHKMTPCTEQVYDYCSEGHLLSRRCSSSTGSCKVCVELQRIKKEEDDELRRLDALADEQRRTDELQRARLKADISRLKQKQAAAEARLAARKEEVALELQKKLLERELKLQMEQGEREHRDWEKKERKGAAEGLAKMEAQVKAEAAFHAEQEKAREEDEANKETLRKLYSSKLEEVEGSLNKMDVTAKKQAQNLEHLKMHASAAATGSRAGAMYEASNDLQTFRTMGHWRQLIAKAAKPGRAATELPVLRAELAKYGSASDQADLTESTTQTLNAMFECKSLGPLLLEYASAGDSPAPKNKHTRGLALMKDGKWLDASNYFGSFAESVPDANDRKVEEIAWLAVCNAKLGFNKSVDASAAPVHHRDDHPAWHLAAALVYAEQIQKLQESGGSSNRPKMVRLDWYAWAVGEALAFLLHPDASGFPPALAGEAVSVLESCGPAFGNTSPARFLSSSHGSSSGAKKAQQSSTWSKLSKRSEAFTKALKLTGLDPVKQSLYELVAQVDLLKEQIQMSKPVQKQAKVQSKQYNAIFYGNPGTGKTNVARLYAELLKELECIPESMVVEESGASLLQGGVSLLQKHLKTLDKGGVLFLDEAYQLNPKTNPTGAQVLDALLPEMENRRGKLVVIFAGYKKQMEGLLAHNEGLPSRFTRSFTFPDYSDEELLEILQGVVSTNVPLFKLENERHAKILACRLGRQRGQVGFGNARAVRNVFEQALARQAARVSSQREAGGDPDIMLVNREDLLGPKFLDSSDSSALKELRSMRGLQEIKEEVKNMLALVHTNAELEEREKPIKELCLNRVFIGNPGTGKTTVAKIYGCILHDLGFLSKGDVVVKNPSDFVGSVLGQSDQNTKAILEAARGCVLVIDEAYGLNPGKMSDPYKTAVIDTIVAEVQGVPGDDRCVLFLGYEEEMADMMRNANPGLARRFQWQNPWRFQDYSQEDLLYIMRGASKSKYSWDLSPEVLRSGIKALEGERRKPNFGNAGAVNNLLSLVAQRMENRLKDLTPAERANEQPIATDFYVPKTPATDIFDDLIGCKEVLDQMKDMQATILGCQRKGKDPLSSMELNFCFVGAPGTGKTTVAKRFGLLLESLGLLATSDIEMCSASNFETGYVGQSSGKTREIFKKAVGGVLFIDEAYRLNPAHGGPFMTEVMDEIVQLLTEEAFMGKMVVILAGYEQQVEETLAVNPGLKSRFNQRIFFPDFSCEDACTLFRMQLQKEYDLELSPEADSTLPTLMDQIIRAPGWANGRDVGTLVKRTNTEYSKRVFVDQTAMSQDDQPVSESDLEASFKSLLKSKPAAPTVPRQSPRNNPGSLKPQYAFDASQAAPPPPIRLAEPVVEIIPEDDPEVAAEVQMAEATDDEIWAALEEACGELGYDLDKVASILRPGGEYPAELLDLVQSKSECNDRARLVAVLDKQKPDFLKKIEMLIELREEERTETEKAIQAKLKTMGICPMGYQWLKVSGGWRCAGGSHYMRDGDL